MTKYNLIAEIGINHNGDTHLAFEMIERAKVAGADFVKFQKRDVDTCYSALDLAGPCKSPWGETVGAKVRGREFSWAEMRAVAGKCSREGIGWGSSCFDLVSLRELEDRFGDKVAFHKVPSCMAKHDAFLREIASYKRLTLVSLGLAADLVEVAGIAAFFETAGCPYVLNATTALYPTPPNRCNLARVRTLRKFRDARLSGLCRGIGYSGHESGVLPSVIAGFMGAEWIERHFTTDRAMYGADQSASLEPEGLRRLRRDLDQLREIVGEPDVQLFGDEKNPVPTLKGQ